MMVLQRWPNRASPAGIDLGIAEVDESGTEGCQSGVALCRMLGRLSPEWRALCWFGRMKLKSRTGVGANVLETMGKL
jgi:hypothetical protein